jgi:hypothetical protein
MMVLVQAAITPILAPVLARMAEQEVTIRTQAEMIGRQSAELDAARVEIQALLARIAARPVEPSTEPLGSRWRAWGAGALMVLTIIALVVLLAWRA